MKNQSPKKTMDCLEKIVEAWQNLAPTTSFGGIHLADFQAKITASQTARVEVMNKDVECKAAIVSRETADAAAMAFKTLIVNGVVGDPNFGPNSALYEAMGYVRKDDRASGLTRKKKELVS
jgi:hypothetical protein